MHMKNIPEIPADRLYRLYVSECLTGKEIAEILKTSVPRIYRLLRKYRIPTRPKGSGSIRLAREFRMKTAEGGTGRMCMALNNDGSRCSNSAVKGRRYCWVHLDEVV